MIEQIDNKLKKDINTSLSIEELKVLYGIDYNIDKSLYKYTHERNIYNDLVKVFGEKYVARNESEINTDTICFIGSIIFDKKLPTYNLKYVYGGLYYFYQFFH